MIWFKKKEETGAAKESKPKVPDGLWIKCEACKEIIYKAEVERALKVCPKCNYHFRIGAKERLALLLDPGSFKEYDARLHPTDPLHFRDLKSYRERVREAKKSTGMNEAVLCGTGKIGGFPVSITAFEFAFLGGSMASVVGEKITRAIERAIKERCPVIIISSSGGARMQEGVLSLMQMAKTSAALAKLGKAGQAFISVLTDPTTGGVTASFAMLGDIILAEPKALIGFAGPRVIEQTIRQELPAGFQRSEFLLEHGMIDMIVERKSMREVLIKLLGYLSSPPSKKVS
jgi:acetyl-CoA carboxylase carboxyl transferase subunit beta